MMLASRRTLLFLFPVICLVCCDFFSGILRADPGPVFWKADNSEAFLTSGGAVSEVILKGNVFLVSGDRTITAEEGHYFPDRQEAVISGNVRLLLPAGTVDTDEAFYNFQNGFGFTGPATFSNPPWFGKAERIEIEGSDTLLLRNGYLTTCDLAHPHYRVTLKSASVKKDEWIKIRSATFRVGKVPVLHLPVFSQSLDSSAAFGLGINPVLNSIEGFQVYTTLRYNTPQEHYSLDLDYRGEEGFGFGPGLKSSRWGQTEIKTYFIRDLKQDQDRYRLEAWHRSIFPRGSGEDNLLLQVHKFSDAGFLKDYFWREYNQDVARNSFLSYSLNRKNYYAGFLLDGELDNYHNLTQRLPELTFFSPFRKAVGSYWQEEAALNVFAKEFSGKTEETTRFHLTETVSRFYPLAGGVFRPFISGGATYYSQDRFGEERTRYFSETGFDLGWKLARTVNRKSDSNRVHYLEPRIIFLARDVSLAPEKLFYYDDTDQIQSDQLLSFQLLNRLKLNRPEGSFEELRFDLKADYSIKRERFGNLRSLLVFDPRRTLTLRNESEFNLDAGKCDTTSTSLVWQKNGYGLRLNHGYQRNESQTLTPGVSIPFGSKWRVDSYATYNLNDSKFEGREISIWRDLHCWESRLGLYQDQAETEIYVIFTLKGFPEDALKIKSHLY
ncbi:MAG: LPS assembly protein LptD [Candidatus Omnitrophota bacterium]